MAEHVHVHVPEELAEGLEGNTRRDRFLEFAAVFLMAFATVGIAWSGYQAASWSGAQAESYAASNSEHEHASQTGTLGTRLVDWEPDGLDHANDEEERADQQHDFAHQAPSEAQ